MILNHILLVNIYAAVFWVVKMLNEITIFLLPLSSNQKLNLFADLKV